MQQNRLPYILVSFFLTLTLGAWILVVAFDKTVGHAEQTKELLHKSGIYKAVIPAQLAEAQKNNPSLSNIPIQNDKVQELLGESLDAQKLQAEGDKAVDNIYAWLEGKSERPKLAIDVAADPQALSASLSDLAAKHAATLRPCVPGQDDYSTFSSDPISANCLPPGVTPDTVRSYVTQSVQGNPILTSTTQLTEEDVKLTNGKTIMESFDGAPVWYQRGQLLPMILATAAVFWMLMMILILKPLFGIKSIGKHMLAVGITLAAVGYAITWIIELIYKPFSTGEAFGEALVRLSNQFNASLRDNIVALSAWMAIVGFGLFAITWIIARIRRVAPATARPASYSTAPESLAKAPTAASFTPLVSKTATKATGAPALPKSSKTTPKKKPAARKKKK